MRRGRGSLALAAAAFLGACLGETVGLPTDPGVPAFQIEVVLVNEGDGSGLVAITYFQLTVDGDPLTVNLPVFNPCPTVLGPRGSCHPIVTPTTTVGVELEAEAEPNSEFQAWSGDCSGAVSRCIIDPLPPALSVFNVRVVFDLVVGEIVFTPAGGTVTVGGGDLDLNAAAYTDQTQTVPVAAAEFTWASSNPAVAMVTSSNPSSAATVSGVAPGTAWIRATARTKTDSVLVVVQ